MTWMKALIVILAGIGTATVSDWVAFFISYWIG